MKDIIQRKEELKQEKQVIEQEISQLEKEKQHLESQRVELKTHAEEVEKLEVEVVQLKQKKAILVNDKLDLEKKNNEILSKVTESVRSEPTPTADKDMSLDDMAAALAAKRPDNLDITVNFSGVNSIREANNQSDMSQLVPESQMPLIAEDEAEIRVETPTEKEALAPIAGSEGVINPNRAIPVPYEKAVEWFGQWLDEGKLDGKKVTVYDTIGFTDQFSDRINIVAKKEHEFYRTEAGAEELEKVFLESHELPTYTLGHWQVIIHDLQNLKLGNDLFLDRFHAASDVAVSPTEKEKGKESKSDVLTELRQSIQVEYVTGAFPPESEGHPIRHVQLAGDKEQPVDKWKYEISVVADYGQHVRIFRDEGFTEDTRIGSYYVYETDVDGFQTHSPGDANGGQLTITK